jgi:diguanylate cyclase (GGDEF)-like protein/PAS domain S-box-containing protein
VEPAGPTAQPRKPLSLFLEGWHGRLALALVAYVAVLVGGIALYPDGGDRRDFLRDLATLPISPVVALLAFGAAAARGVDPASRMAWRRLGIARVFYAAGDLFWFLDTSLGRDHPPLSIASLCYLIYNPTLLWGLLSFPNVLRGRREKAQFWLDAGTGFLGGAMLWYFAVGPLYGGAAFASGAATLSTLFLVLDLLLVLGISVTLQRRTDPGDRPIFLVLASGMMFALAGDLLQGHFAVEHVSDRHGPDALFILNAALVGLSAHLQVWRAKTAVVTIAEAPAAAPTFNLLPYASVAFGYGILLLAVFREQWPLVGGLAVLAVALTTVVVIRQVITARENMVLLAEQATRQSEARFRALVQNSSDVILLVDALMVVRYQTPSAERVLGYAADALVGKRLTDVVHGDDQVRFGALIAQALASAGVTGPGELRLICEDGSWLFVDVTVTNLVHDRELTGLVLTVRDVHDRKLLEERLSYQAFHDPLTGLANRALLTNRLTHALAGARRDVRTLALLLLDLDNFKTVNDSLGHEFGDRVLSAIGERLREATGEAGFIARLGGDEFTIISVEGAQPAAAEALADQLLSAIAEEFNIDGHQVRIGLSIGVSIFPTDANDDTTLVANADAALYRAKSEGRGTYRFFEAGMDKSLRERRALQHDLQAAMERNELTLYYQPQARISGEIIGFEALVRWRHPTRGMISPGTFIPLAEESGLIVPLGEWILREACREAASWPKPLQIGINLSPIQFRHGDLVAMVHSVLLETGLPPSRLELEITEGVFLNEDSSTDAMFAALKRIGVRLALDDFGTGYSSLNYLRTFPLDKLKIDQSFIRDLDTTDGARSIVRTIISLAKSLNLVTTAEGVETREQLAWLREEGCTEAQGYLFSPPMPASEVQSLLSAKKGIRIVAVA